MESRTLDNLILENEDFFFTGNLTIIGDVNISNGSIIIAGNLTLQDNVNVENGNILVVDLSTVSESYTSGSTTMVAAIPDPEQDDEFWAYTSVPEDRCKWWEELPTR